MPSVRAVTSLLVVAILATVACTQDPAEDRSVAEDAAAAPRPAPSGPPGARWDIVEMLRESRAQVHHPSDGGGKAWRETAPGEPAGATAGRAGRFTVVYEAGPEGIATGGMVYLQVSPFWGWSTPQTERPDAPGYTTVATVPPDLALAARTLDRQLLGLEVTGRPLAAGDRVRIVYGAGAAGARVDRYAERGSRFWIAVDGDGDGVRRFLPDSPAVDIAAGAPATMLLTAPSVVRPGAAARIAIACLDGAGNTGVALEGPVAFEPAAGVDLPAVTLAAGDGGRATATAVFHEPGIVRLRATGPGGLAAESNPVLVSAEAPAILWGDLHGHSHLSDGTGTPDDYFAYARDVAALDVAALTDHDHWGILPLDSHPALWEEIRAAVARFHAPGRFVTLLGYEWTSWIYGHRHVLYFDDDGPVLSSVDPAYESPRQLWQALAGRRALTFAHHSAGGPIPTDWTIAPDPVLEPVTEVASVHGASEAPDAPKTIYKPVAGNFVRDALGRGYRLGFIGSGDSHDGHPGLAHLAAPSGGLAAILAGDVTREGVLAALRARRTYATNGPRIILQVALGTHPMGTTVAAGPSGSVAETLVARAIAPAPLERLDVVSGAAVVATFDAGGAREVAVEHDLADLRAGDWVYVRAVQADGGAAWSSPIFVE